MKDLLNVCRKLYFLLLFTYLKLLEEKFLVEVGDKIDIFVFKGIVCVCIFIDVPLFFPSHLILFFFGNLLFSRLHKTVPDWGLWG